MCIHNDAPQLWTRKLDPALECNEIQDSSNEIFCKCGESLVICIWLNVMALAVKRDCFLMKLVCKQKSMLFKFSVIDMQYKEYQ